MKLPTRTPATRLSTRELGALGEQCAADHLTRSGWQVVERNVRFRSGELDIVAMDGATLVFVEVKTRRSERTGPPQAAVTPTKLRRLRHLVGQYLLQGAPRHRDLRIDVLAVRVLRDGTGTIEHFEGVF